MKTQRRRSALIWAWVAFAGIGAAASPAAAYVRARDSNDDLDLIWPQPEITLTVRLGGALPLSQSDVLQAVSRAVDAWNAAQNDSSVSFVVTSSDEAAADPAFDHENTISFRTSGWEPPSYEPNVLALTTIWTQGGAIVDTDTEINAETPPAPWGLLPDDPAMAMTSNQVDLQAAITHELGHVLGLAHPCGLGGMPNPPEIDNEGNPVPACASTLPARILDATMYPSATPGEISERSLSADEMLALTDLYPAGSAPVVEGDSPAGPSTGGCEVGGPVGDVRWGAGAIAFLAVMTALARRWRRRVSADPTGLGPLPRHCRW